MNVAALILLIVAFAVFVVDALVPPGRYRATAIGLALLTAGLIVQFCSTSHTVTW